MPVGKPRFDDYIKLLHRLYEPLIILKILLGNSPLGPYLVANHEPNNPVSVRRKFLKNLAYPCDFSKGGASTASIGVEEREDCFVFWLAMNDDDDSAAGEDSRGVAFLRGVLSRLQRLIMQSGAERGQSETELLEYCVEHVSNRVKKEAKSLSSSVKKSVELLQRENEESDIIQWLRRFEYDCSTEPLDICQFAFQSRHDNMMSQLAERLSNLSAASELAKHLSKVQHYIGRLGHHIRATKELIRDAMRFEEVLTSSWQVHKIPTPVYAPAPEADNHTHLSGIINRMIRPHEKEEWNQVTAFTDSLSILLTDERIVEFYNSRNFKPRVHAEVQVLEHFYKNGLRFAWNDRFVATSKMACFCCKLYFRYHPAHPIEPESHEKVYHNWGPIFLPGGRDHPEFVAHRQMMSKVIDGIREEALRMLSGLTNGWSFHNDSLTGITAVSSSDWEVTSNSFMENSGQVGYATADGTLIATEGLWAQSDSDSSEDSHEGLDGGAPL